MVRISGNKPPLVTTLITPWFSLAVVTSHATTPATKPITEPQIQPHLLALLQVMASAMGHTADPKITTIKVYRNQHNHKFFPRRRKGTYIKPTHGYSDEEEDYASQPTHD